MPAFPLALLAAAYAPAMAPAGAPPCPDLTTNAAELCADAKLRKAWSETEALYHEWLAADPRKITVADEQADTLDQFRRGFQYSEDGSPQEASADSIVEDLGYTNVQLRANIGLVNAIETPASLADELAERCMARSVKSCKVKAAGWLNGPDEGPQRRVAWQVVEGLEPNEVVPVRMTLAWDVTGAGSARLIGMTISDGETMPPRLVDNGEDFILHLPGYTAGTGQGNADTLYLWRSNGWANIGMTSWKAELEEKLPPGLGLWKGVEYDYYGLSSYFPLWRDSDANCCPTGGNAYAAFAIRDDRLTIDTLEVYPGPATQIKTPQCPIEQALYTFPGDWTYEFAFRKPRFAPNAQSDLVMEVTGKDDAGEPAWRKYYAFAGSQGFGSASLIEVDGPGSDDGPLEMADDDGEEGSETIHFHAFDANSNGITYRADPPMAGESAPIAIFLPDLARALWYDGVTSGDGTRIDRVDMPRDMADGTCQE
ncbi:MAG: hypothetical protein R3E02_08725 [Blastomonas sp.]